MKKTKKLLIAIAGVLVLCLLAAVAYVLIRYHKYTKDFMALRTESYDTVFFSMYPISNYDEADYAYFRGMNVVKSSVEIADSKILKTYMDIAAGTENVLSTVYLGVDPVLTDTEDIFQISLENPGIMFEIVLAYPELNYWLSMEESECRKVWETYREFAGNVLGLENVRVYYFCNEEWLLCNPGNYVDTYNTNKEVSNILMCHSDYLHNNILDVNNFHVRFDRAWELIEMHRAAPMEYSDLSELEIIFFGDSVIGNYADSTSVPGVVNGLTGAKVYNCGVGGTNAAFSPNKTCSLTEIVNAFIGQDLSMIPAETQAYSGIEQYTQEGDKSKQKMFVLNYGLNDFFRGVPISLEDPFDRTSYSGAIRTAVCALKEAYPDADILLLTPNKTIEYGAGEQIQSEIGSKLQDYADAVINLADESDVEVLDNFHELPINIEKYWELLEDGTHPNGQGRFLIGMRIADRID